MDNEKIYLDYNATTPVDPRVLDVMARVSRENFGNPSSSHCFGRPAGEIVNQARLQVATALKAEPQEGRRAIIWLLKEWSYPIFCKVVNRMLLSLP